MSNQNLFLRSGFPRAPGGGAAGVGRTVGQLQRIVLKFCKSHGSSRGMRDFIEQELVDYAKQNPGVVVYLKPRRHRSPVIVGEYLNGDRVWMNFYDKSQPEISKWMELMRTQACDISSTRLRKFQHTEHPSVQGPWTPFTFKEPALNTARLPSPQHGANDRLPPTATELLEAMMNSAKLASD